MKKNKKSRIFSRVLDRLAWANFYHVNDENGNAYKEVLVAKRSLEECGCENVKVDFYAREYRVYFEVYHPGHECNRYYIGTAGHGYVNRYHVTNWDNVNCLIERLEIAYSRALRLDFHDYQLFQQNADNVLWWILTTAEYVDFCKNGKIGDIPYDVSIRLWQDLRDCAESVVLEAITYRKVEL